MSQSQHLLLFANIHICIEHRAVWIWIDGMQTELNQYLVFFFSVHSQFTQTNFRHNEMLLFKWQIVVECNPLSSNLIEFLKSAKNKNKELAQGFTSTTFSFSQLVCDSELIACL